VPLRREAERASVDSVELCKVANLGTWYYVCVNAQ
jgi:hypothetical protein